MHYRHGTGGHIDHMESPVGRLRGGIPKILHQSWKTAELRGHHKTWQATWKANHPTWRYILWTDATNRELVAEHFPWFLSVYDGFPANIHRADAARYFYMLQYGGVYVDMDMESIRPYDTLLDGLDVALAWMGENYTAKNRVPNAFLASVPNHGFWMYMLRCILETNTTSGDVLEVTGPWTMLRATAEYNATSGSCVPMIMSKYIYAVTCCPDATEARPTCQAQKPDTFNATACKAHFPEAYSISYWTTTYRVGHDFDK